MKTRNLARWVPLAGLMLALGACDSGLTQINDNPNAPTDVGPEFLLPQAERAAVEASFGAGQMLSHTSIWPQLTAQIQYPDEEQGLVRQTSMQGYWDGAYAGPLEDIQTVIDKGVESSRPNIQAVGMIWKSFIFSMVTDFWGDVPYSQALSAPAGITAPTYDAQQDIYDGLLQSLTDAAGMLSSSGSGFGSGDLLYNDDMEKWRRFANSLRMRLAMRLSEVDESTAQSEFVAAYNAGGFQSLDDAAMFQWAAAPYQNPLYENWTGRDDHGISETLVDTLTSLDDPRLALYAEPAEEDGAFRGRPNGVQNAPLSLAWYSRIGNFWRADGAATPTSVMSYAEVLFLEAEAAARGWIGGDPASLYNQAIRASMNQYDAWSPANAPTDAEIDAYMAQTRVQYTDINDIHLQKWIALYLNGPEAWFNWRRVDVPNLVPGPDLAISRIPVRFEYPAGEQSLNADNLAAAVARQGGGNDLVTTVWWDVH